VASGQLQNARLDSPAMARRVVCATNIARPATQAKAAVHALVQEVIREMVQSKSWPGRWVGTRP